MIDNDYLALAGIPIPMALASIALLGYMVGRWKRVIVALPGNASRRDLARGRKIVQSFELVSRQVQSDLADHMRHVRRFRLRLEKIDADKEASWIELCDEAERILAPTQRCVTQLAHAHDLLRQQASQLMTFTELRNDPLTGVHNRRGLDESLKLMFAMLTRYKKPFSILMLDIDHFKQINDRFGHVRGDQVLRDLADAMVQAARDADVVARYGGEEFSIVLPETTLEGACEFADRLRNKISASLSVTVSVGVAQARADDSASTLLDVADSALYAAKSDGRNCVYHHDRSRVIRTSPRVVVRSTSALPDLTVLNDSHVDTGLAETVLNQQV